MKLVLIPKLTLAPWRFSNLLEQRDSPWLVEGAIPERTGLIVAGDTRLRLLRCIARTIDTVRRLSGGSDPGQRNPAVYLAANFESFQRIVSHVAAEVIEAAGAAS